MSFSERTRQINFVIFAANANSNEKVSADLGEVESWLSQNALKNGFNISGRNELAGNTMYKMSGTSDAYTLSRHPTLYARNDTSTIKVVDVKREIVKRDFVT